MTDNAIITTPENETVIYMSAPVSAIPRSIFTMTAEHLERMKLVAEMCAASTLSYAKNGSQKLTKGDLFLIMLKGVEVGLEPMAALTSIDLIQGVPALDPQGMLALINRSGQLEDIVIDSSDIACTVTMTRKGRTAHTETFSIEDATSLGLAIKDNWKRMPRVMLKWRCVSACCRVVFPDVIQGLYTQEEMGAEVEVTEDGKMRVVAPVSVPTPKPAENKPTTEDVRKSLGNGDAPRRVETASNGKTEPPAATGETTGEGEGDTPDGDPKPKYDLPEVVRVSLPFFTNMFEQSNSLKKMIDAFETPSEDVADDEVIRPNDDTGTAVARVFIRRARKDYGVEQSQIVKALNAAQPEKPVTSLKEWRAAKRTWADALKAIQVYAEMTKLPPATTKDKKRGKKDKPPAEAPQDEHAAAVGGQAAEFAEAHGLKV